MANKIRFFIYFIIALLLCPATALTENALTTKQETHGNQSSIINAGRDVNLNYLSGFTYKDLLEMSHILCEDLQRVRSSMEEDANKEAQKLRAALARTFAVGESSSKDAEERALQFIHTIPSRKEKIRLQYEDIKNKNLNAKDEVLVKSKKIETKIDFLFAYILNYIDPFISVLEKEKKIKSFESEDAPIFCYETSCPEKRVRNIIFNYGGQIEVLLSAGRIDKGIIHNYPVLHFKGIVGNLDHLNFSTSAVFQGGATASYASRNNPLEVKEVKPKKIPDVAYFPGAEDVFFKNYKERFRESFDALFEQVFVIDSFDGNLP